MADPLAYLRRSPLRRLLDQEGAQWREIAGTAAADRLSTPPGPARLAIGDLSPLPRLGFKGRGTIEAMKKRGVAVEAAPNKAFRQPGGGLCLVLAPGEVILLAGLDGGGSDLDSMQASWTIEDEERTYPLLRRDSHHWFAVTGADAPAMFAKICAIDLNPQKFADLSIAQTSVAKMTAIIVRADIGGHLAFYVLADSAGALYFCSALLDAAHEFKGRLVGLADVQSLERQ